MKKFPSSLEVILLQSVALVCVIFDIGDVFNIINILPASYLPMLTLLLVALLLSSQANLQKHMMRLEKDVHKYNRENDIKYLDQAYTQVSEHLRGLIGDEFFIELFSSLQTILKDQVIHFKEGMQFLYHYSATLKHYQSETFLFLTNVSTCDLWLDPEIKAINERFIKGGGKIEQILLFEHASELNSVTVRDFLAHQNAINIEVFFVSALLIPYVQIQECSRRNSIVGAKANVVWEVFADRNRHIGSSTLITNPDQINEYRRVLQMARKYRTNLTAINHIA